MKSPLRWPGGKGRLAGEILAYVGEHQAYVEACCGGAAVFWAKPREWSAAEILNDADGELINFYYELHKHGRRLAAEVNSMPYSRRLLEQMKAHRPGNRFGRAARFWYLNRVRFGAIGSSCTYGVKVAARAYVLPDRLLKDLDATIERLRGVAFESVDVVRLIRLYDRRSTLFYLDPPYVGPRGLYACDFGPEDHRRLALALRAANGTWLLSYDDCGQVRRLYSRYPKRRLMARYSIRTNTRDGDTKVGRELLISNRPLRRVSRK